MKQKREAKNIGRVIGILTDLFCFIKMEGGWRRGRNDNNPNQLSNRLIMKSD